MDPLRTASLPRNQIAQFIGEERGVRAFEALQGDTTVIYETLATASFLTVSNEPGIGSERVLAPVAGDLAGTDGGAGSTYTLGLANTAVTAGNYGGAGNLVSFTVDAKGRLTAAATVAGADLTKADDTNVTLTLGGTPTASLLKAVSLTLGWTGTLAVARGGTGGGSASGTLLDNITGFASTGHMVRTGAGAYAFRTLTGPAAGISITNGSGVGGNPTLALADDLAALEALSGTNTIYYRSGASTWTGVTIGAGLSFSGGTLATSGTFTGTTRAISASDNVAAADYLILVDATGGAVTVTLPAAASSAGRMVMVKKTDAGANNVIIDGNGAETIDGAPNVTFNTQYQSYSVMCDGTIWWVV